MNQAVIFFLGFLSGLLLCLLALRYWFQYLPVSKEKGVSVDLEEKDDNVTTKLLAYLREDPFLTEVQKMILQNLDQEDFSINQLASSLAVSRSKLFRKVKDKTGLSPSSLVRSIRLTKAQQLLSTTEMNVTQVAYAVGYKDIAHFSRCFTDRVGTPPKQWRKLKQGKQRENLSLVADKVAFSFS